jgi:hypothetical protein
MFNIFDAAQKSVRVFLSLIFPFPKALCPDMLEEFVMPILENEGPNAMVFQQDGAITYFRITIRMENFHGN